MPERASVLGFFTAPAAAQAAFNALIKGGFRSTALLSRQDNNAITRTGSVSQHSLNAYGRWLVRGETLVLVDSTVEDAHRALEIFQQDDDETPATFVFYPESGMETAAQIAPPPDPPTADRLIQTARELAAAHTVTTTTHRGRPLLHNLIESETTLKRVRLHLSEAARVEQGLLLSAEWLLDNAYIIQGHITDFKRNLPRRFYEQLPVVAQGPQTGQPRAYSIAVALIEATDGLLSRDSIYTFLQTYQATTALTMGELWALPLMLRLRLIERLRELALTVDLRQRERELADFWASRLLAAARKDPDQMISFLAELTREQPTPTAHFADQLVSHLHDEEAASLSVRQWLERKLALPLSESMMQDQHTQAVQQIALGNAITSLRQISQLDWREVFESVSRVDNVLYSDPAGIYPRMSFPTRDRYRHAIEEISRRSGLDEIEVALEVVKAADEQDDEVKHHVGYYLLDSGRPEFERRVNSKPGSATLLRRAVRKHPAALYSGSVGLLTALMLGLLASWGGREHIILLLLLALLPVSEIAVQIVNYVITRLMPPDFLPRMSFEQGIPENFRTLVVVPMMMLAPSSIAEELERLEIRFLANPDDNLRFALLSDFSDAPQQTMPEDAELLDIAARALDRMNAKYGAGTFLLFHRDREWSASEDRWMGWERKRGKLEQMNAYLMGEPLPTQPNFLRYGDPARLKGIRFVITLDSDTQMPRGTARKMVETLAHPLNLPRLAPDGSRLDRGYTLLQPRVSTALPSATATLFSRLFTDTTGTDPYTNVVSDVYQDLVAEGSYHGKGIYDLTAFHTILKERFPERHLLSHDLIEGVHVRVAFVSDIELFDLFPRDYVSYSSRQHRWVRGDWQIADWILPRVPNGKGETVPNPLRMFSRWKVFDNLRRSLLPVAAILLLLAGWFLSPMPALWSWLTALMLFMPTVISLTGLLTTRPQLDPKPVQDLAIGFVRNLLFIALMPHQAILTLDAMARIIYRRLVSHKLLLEWETASEAVRKSRNRRKVFVRNMAWISAGTLAIAVVIDRKVPTALNAAVPFLLFWLLSPLLVNWMNSETRILPEHLLSDADGKYLRVMARQTWRYFHALIGPQTNWLPPDNYQVQIRIEVAPRTSPTNIGLWLLAALAAHDFGYATIDDILERLHHTMQTLDGLERFEGHFMNWYDIYTKSPLPPRYVSMVDSGNLLGHLWTFAQGLEEKIAGPVLDGSALRGIEDTIAALRQTQGEGKSRDNMTEKLLESLTNLCHTTAPLDLGELAARLRSLREPAQSLVAHLKTLPADAEPVRYWAGQIAEQAEQWNVLVDRYLSWAEVLRDMPREGLLSLGSEAHEWRRTGLAAHPSLRDLAAGSVAGMTAFVAMCVRAETMDVSQAMQDWLKRLADAFQRAEWFAGEKLAQGEAVLNDARRFGRRDEHGLPV